MPVSFSMRNTMLKPVLLFSCLLMSLIVTPAWAQPRRGAPEDVSAVLKERLALTDTQAVAVRAVVDSFRAEINARREEFAGDRQAAMPIIMALREQMYDRIGELLTEPQTDEFVKYRKEREEQLRERFRNRNRE